MLTVATSMGRCRLLELPAEIREQIWLFAVIEAGTSQSPPRNDSHDSTSVTRSHRIPIRMDRFNKPLSPSITRVSKQTREETLKLYYEHNIFECWRPLFWVHDWSQSTFIDWLTGLGPLKTSWLTDIVLLYKHEGELDHDIEGPLAELGFELRPDIISSRLELSEYEMCYETLGLPRHFGTKRRWDRWLAAGGG